MTNIYVGNLAFSATDEDLRTAMQDELRRLAQAVILVGDGKLETLLTAPYSYIDGPLFDLYGVQRPAGHRGLVVADGTANLSPGL